MFTGIVEHMGTVAGVDHGDGIRTFQIDLGPLGGVSIGDSVAINGVCLTATSVESGKATFEAVEETLTRTNLGRLEEGASVNLERAMPATGRFDGHLVQGHVDGVGRVVGVAGDRSRLFIEVPEDMNRYVVEKGSITVDGVSLTVAAVDQGTIEIALIPHTLASTTLGLRNAGDTVNLEADVLAKYVERLMNTR